MAIQINQRCEQIMFTIFFIVEYLFPAGSHPVCRSTPYWMSWMTTQVSERSLLRTWGTKCMGSWWGTRRTWRERENMWVPNTCTWDTYTHALVKFNTSCILNIVVLSDKQHLQEGRKTQQYLDQCWKHMDNVSHFEIWDVRSTDFY